MEEKATNYAYDNFSIGTEEDLSFLTPDNYAAIYARKSNKNESHSINSQIYEGRRVINAEGLLLYKSYWDSESASKYTYDKRNGFCELLKDLENGKFKTIVVFKRDRLSRNFNELLSIKKLCRKHDVKIIYSASGEFQTDPTNSYSDFIENILMGIAELESKEIDTRTSIGRRAKREKGLYSKGRFIPFGLAENVDEYQKQYKDEYVLVPDKDESPIVKAIFEKYLSCDESIENLLKLAQKMHPDKTNLTLNTDQIKYMLTNPIYVALQGPKNNNSLFIKDKETNKYTINFDNIKPLVDIKPILDKDLWSKTALKYLNNKKNRNPRIKNYLFKNLLVCSKCNEKIYISGSYYRCKTKSCTSFKKDFLVNLLIRQIISDLYTPQDAKELIDSRISIYAKEKSKLKKSLEEKIESKQKLLLDFVKEPNNADYSQDLKLVIEEESNLISDINTKEDKIESINSIHDHMDELRDIGSSNELITYFTEELDTDILQKILERLIEKISIDGKADDYTIEQIDYGSS